MSRSRKKYPVYKEKSRPGVRKFFKRKFNKRLRQKGWMDIDSGMAYKKLNESYDICDFRFLPRYDDPEDVRRAGMK